MLPQKKAAFFVRAGLFRSRQMPLGVSARLRAYISWASGQQHLDQRLSPGPAGLPGRRTSARRLRMDFHETLVKTKGFLAVSSGQ